MFASLSCAPSLPHPPGFLVFYLLLQLFFLKFSLVSVFYPFVFIVFTLVVCPISSSSSWLSCIPSSSSVVLCLVYLVIIFLLSLIFVVVLHFLLRPVVILLNFLLSSCIPSLSSIFHFCNTLVLFFSVRVFVSYVILFPLVLLFFLQLLCIPSAFSSYSIPKIPRVGFISLPCFYAFIIHFFLFPLYTSPSALPLPCTPYLSSTVPPLFLVFNRLVFGVLVLVLLLLLF